jgi:hypothetical protein
VIAVIRPTGWDLPLFLHVLGATALFGAVGTVGLLAAVGLHRPERVRLARGSFGTLVAVALPAWVLMLIAGTWTRSKEHLPNATHWVQVPVGIAGGGLMLLLLAAAVAFVWTRRPYGSWQPQALATLSVVFMTALAVAWWIMTSKPAL